ncbi:MAG: methyltransferase domain-containing protein [Flavobacteriales bacterium]|nr:methyltransferase domain-containing protein [Flavobacteriales bacterium]
MKITYKEFQKIYNKHLEVIYSFWTAEMQANISKHNLGWAEHSFEEYLRKSVKRFYLAYKNIPEGAKTCCDIGGFWGIYPIVLKELGYDVVMTESLKFYDKGFDKLFKYVEEQGVKILDIDPFMDEFDSSLKFDYISILAVLEHIPHSVSFFMNNIKKIMNNGGGLYIEVPNIAYARKRFALLRGKTPLPNIEVIYNSASPFIGHHHEYTLMELKSLFVLNNLQIKNVERFNYTMEINPVKLLRYPLSNLSFAFIPNSREILGVLGQK